MKSRRNVYSKLSHPKLEREARSPSPQCGLCLLTGARGAARRLREKGTRALFRVTEDARRAASVSEIAAAGGADPGRLPPDPPVRL